MIDLNQLFASFIEGVTKALPALLAAYYAYKLWRQKLMQDRADAVIKGCLLFRNFCSMLSGCILDDPDKPNPVSIESVNGNLESILSTASTSAHFNGVMETFALWRKRVYFGSSSDLDSDVTKRRALLDTCISDCDRVMATIRDASPSQLLKIRLAHL